MALYAPFGIAPLFNDKIRAILATRVDVGINPGVHIAALAGRPVTLPALRMRRAALVSAIVAACAADPHLVAYAPDTGLEAVFGRLPPLVTARAERAGFRHDGSLGARVAAALDDCEDQAHRDAA